MLREHPFWDQHTTEKLEHSQDFSIEEIFGPLPTCHVVTTPQHSTRTNRAPVLISTRKHKQVYSQTIRILRILPCGTASVMRSSWLHEHGLSLVRTHCHIPPKCSCLDLSLIRSSALYCTTLYCTFGEDVEIKSTNGAHGDSGDLGREYLTRVPDHTNLTGLPTVCKSTSA